MHELAADCPNCNDGCKVLLYCEGCHTMVCALCYGEHNYDAPCHLPPPDCACGPVEEGEVEQ